MCTRYCENSSRSDIHGNCVIFRCVIPLTTSSSSSTSRRLRPLFHQTPILQNSQCMSHVTDLENNKTLFNSALYQRTHKTKLNCSADNACNYARARPQRRLPPVQPVTLPLARVRYRQERDDVVAWQQQLAARRAGMNNRGGLHVQASGMSALKNVVSKSKFKNSYVT